MRRRKRICMFTDFGKGFIAGVLTSVIVFGNVMCNIVIRNKGREGLIYAERQIEIQEMREDIINRDTADFFDEFPDVRRAADGAASEFERKRDEILQRFRN